METLKRKPFQGVFNIVRFNWHFYIIAAAMILLLTLSLRFLTDELSLIVIIITLLIGVTSMVSLSVSYYVYDYSDLYDFEWLKEIQIPANGNIVNINAGFDETSGILKAKYPQANLEVFDFYDPQKHTEVSIQRARQAYPAFPGTVKIETDLLPVKKESQDLIFNIFAAHEVRNRAERTKFLIKQRQALSSDGRCIVVEHLRDIPNLLAYNVGFFHFHPLAEWRLNFHDAGFKVEHVLKPNPFVSVFILKKKNGTSS
jgi:hypothetical protein